MIEFLKTTEATWAVVLGAIALGVAAYQLFQSNQIRKHEFEDIYVQRYWQIMDRLTSEQKQALFSEDKARKLAHDSEVRDVLWRYLELCEDQADLRAMNMITTSTWHQWHDGVIDAASRPPYATLLDAFIESLGEQENLPFNRLLKARKEDGFYDPRPSWWIRLWRGFRRGFAFAVGRKR